MEVPWIIHTTPIGALILLNLCVTLKLGIHLALDFQVPYITYLVPILRYQKMLSGQRTCILLSALIGQIYMACLKHVMLQHGNVIFR